MKRHVVGVIGVILAITLLIMGLLIKVPSKEISSYSFTGNSYKEYVGGDAYNIMIEASLRGGQIAGARTQKSIYFSAAAILFVFSLYCFEQESVQTVLVQNMPKLRDLTLKKDETKLEKTEYQTE